jgi:DNA-binding Lrp family transcriptional regulator
MCILVATQSLDEHGACVDRLDYALLALLQEDSGRTADRLGEELGLSRSAVTRRIQNLRQAGIIAKEVAILSDRFRESRVTAIVNVQFDRHQPYEADQFRRAIRAIPEVQLAVAITGASDALLLVSVRDMDHFNIFAEELASMPLVRRYETSFIKRTIKFTTAVPIEWIPERGNIERTSTESAFLTDSSHQPGSDVEGKGSS